MTGIAGALEVLVSTTGAGTELSVRGNWGCRGEELCVAESELRKVWMSGKIKFTFSVPFEMYNENVNKLLYIEGSDMPM